MANIAKKLGMSFWTAFIMAIIPIVNIILLLKMAKKPLWWLAPILILFLAGFGLPVLGGIFVVVALLFDIGMLVFFILIWMAIAANMGKPSWWGVIIALVPLLNLIFFLMLVFAEAPNTAYTPGKPV